MTTRSLLLTTRSPLRVHVNLHPQRMPWAHLADVPNYWWRCPACGACARDEWDRLPNHLPRTLAVRQAQQHAERCAALARLWCLTLYHEVGAAAFRSGTHRVGLFADLLERWRRWAE